MKNIFQQGRGKVVPTLFLMVLSIGLMVTDHRTAHLDVIRSAAAAMISPLQFLVSLPPQGGAWVGEWFRTHNRLVAENEGLRESNRMLNARLQKMEVLLEENTRLRNLLGSARKVADQVSVAELLSVDQNPYRQLIELNKGTLDGIVDGQAVIDEHGIMGQVIQSTPNTATVMLVSDPEHAIAVQFIKNGIRSIAFGNGSTDQLELRYLPVTADVMPGDELVTSGLGGRFPPDYPVATVTSVTLDPTDGFVSAIARPKASLDSSRQVLVIRPREITGRSE